MTELEIFDKASDIDDDDEREAFLRQACGDNASLRQRLNALLDFNAEDESFLKDPIVGPTQDWTDSPSEEIGSAIGRYKLLERIGEGGFGVVYMAEQREPVRRLVALKVIKLGMDTRQVIGRFEAERQALAMMDHPNIAKVLDGGATDTGRPYFVMELVKGVAVTEFCDVNQLSVPARLRLFADVCSAVQHAHQKGIIHRDLKPSNVLIGMQDDEPVPKVIDFGVAKAMQQRLTEKTVFTRFQQIIGTPTYMSPEQASFSDLDIDTRSDIYSLGVLLYELLTGATPIDPSSVREAGYEELCRSIREDEALLPSVVITRSGDELAKRRGCDSKALRRTLHGDLDWIVMKALEKNRLRRYETASAFRQDVDNYLADLPVSAGPPRVSYRLSKFVKRNRLFVFTAIMVSLFLIASIFGLGVGNSIISRKNEELENKNEDYEAAARLAEGRFQEANAVVANYLTEVAQSEELLAGTPGTHELRQRLLTMAKDYFLGIVEQAKSPNRHAALANAYLNLTIVERQLGNYEQSKVCIEKAIEAHEMHTSQGSSTDSEQHQMAILLVQLGRVNAAMGDYQAANESYGDAIALFSSLLEIEPTSMLYRAMIDARDGRGWANLRLGRYKESLRDLHFALDLANRHGYTVAGYPIETLSHLGLVYRRKGQTKLSVESFRRGIQLCERDGNQSADLAKLFNNLGITYLNDSQYEKAAVQFKQAITRFQDLALRNPLVDEYRFEMAQCHRNIGIIHNNTDELEDARDRFGAAIELLHRLADEAPTVANYSIYLALNYISLGDVEIRSRSPDVGIDHLIKSFEISEKLEVEDPLVAQTFIKTYKALVPILHSGQHEATKLAENLNAVFERKGFDGAQLYIPAETHFDLGSFFVSQGDMRSAEFHFSEAVRYDQKLITQFPAAEFRVMFATASNNLGKLFRIDDRLAQSAEVYQSAIEVCSGIENLDEEFEAQRQLVKSHTGLALVYRNMSDFGRAVPCFEKSIAIGRQLVEAVPTDALCRKEFASAHANFATCQMMMGNYDGALRSIDKSGDILVLVDLRDHELGSSTVAFNRTVKGKILNMQAWRWATSPIKEERDGQRAVGAATEACELTQWQDAGNIDTLAAAYAEIGRFDQAIKHQSRAIQLAPDINELKEHLKLYEQEQPLRAE